MGVPPSLPDTDIGLRERGAGKNCIVREPENKKTFLRAGWMGGQCGRHFTSLSDIRLSSKGPLVY